jgi:Domain of unknown function (DUF4386)
MIPTKNWARLAGLLYLLVIALGLFAEVFVREALTVSNDAVATLNNIRTAEMRFRLGFTADLVNLICGLPVITFFYFLFKPVNRYGTILAIFFVIISNAIIAANLINQLTPLMLIGSDHYLSAFLPGQLATLAINALNLQEQGYAIALVFFGIYCIIIGWLIYRSAILPRILGILYAIAGVCYLINSFTGFLMPEFRNPLFPAILLPSFIGELSVALWLLIKGVKSDH